METNKDNKRKTRIGIVAVILVLLIAIGSVIGITLAKYVTSADITTQTATVAKWGYTLTGSAAELFGTKYGSVSENFATASDQGVVVNGGSNKVVAPGTKGSASVLTISGSAEVDAVLTITVSDGFKTIHLTNSDNIDYYPIKWSVNGTQVATDNAVTADKFATAIATALNAKLPSGVTSSVNNNVITVNLPAGTQISNFELTISWEWALQTPKGDDGDNYNAEDTILAQIAQAGGTEGAFSDYDGSSWTMSLGLSANVVQVQQFTSQG